MVQTQLSMTKQNTNLDRRKLIVGTSGLIVAGTGLATLLPEPTTALTISGLTISGVNKELGPNQSVQAVSLDLSVSYEYSSSHSLSEVVLECYVKHGSDGSPSLLDTTTISDPPIEDTASTSFTGDITGTDAFSTSDFSVSGGQTNTVPVGVLVVLKLYRDGTRVGVANSDTVADVVVSKEELTVSAVVAGEGSLGVRVG